MFRRRGRLRAWGDASSMRGREWWYLGREGGYEPHPYVSVVSPVVGPLCVWAVAARVARKCYVMLCYAR